MKESLELRVIVEPWWDGVRPESWNTGWEEIRVSWSHLDCTITRMGRNGTWYDTYILTRWEGYDSMYQKMLPEILMAAELVRLYPEEIKQGKEEWIRDVFARNKGKTTNES